MLQPALLHERLFYVRVRYALEVEALRAAAYGVEQLLRFLADEDEHGLRRRLLKQLEQLVGARQIHALRQPDYRHLISALTRLQAQLP